MRYGYLEVPPPKQGSRYRGVAVCRISKESQDKMSLEDQLAYYHEWLKRNFRGEYELTVLASQGSGELLERADFITLTEMAEEGVYDFFIAEDIGRIARRTQAMILCELAEDSATRVIAINDRVDTLADDWRQNAFFATMRHEAYNRDTAARIRRSHRNRFLTGDMVRCLPAGYIKPFPGANESQCSKDPKAEAVFDEWFTRLEREQSFSEVASWLNSIEFPTGKHVKKTMWDGTRVGQVTRNPILKGLRVHNQRMTRRINKTGKRKSVMAPPAELLTRNAPHLAFIETERYDRVIRLINNRNEKFRKGREFAKNGRPMGTRNDSRWPSQHVRCGICGRKYVLGGHGQKERMMCDGARSYQCWNAMTVDRADLASGVSAEIYRQIETLPEFDSELLRQVRAESEAMAGLQNNELQRLNAERHKVLGEIGKLTEAIATLDLSQALLSRLSATEQRLREIDDEIAEVSATVPITPVIPTADELRKLAQQSFLELSVESREYAGVMRNIVRDFYVLPYRLIDGGNISPRVVFKLDLGSIEGVQVPDQLDCMTLDCMIDLTKPPQRVEFRERVVARRESGMKERDVAAKLGITQPAVQNAVKLHAQMIRLGISDPWQPVPTYAEAADRYQRISHPRFCFTPLDGFTPKFPGGGA